MALNKLLFKHQLALMNADKSGLNEDREIARLCAVRISDWRDAKGLPTVGWPDGRRAQIEVR